MSISAFKDAIIAFFVQFLASQDALVAEKNQQITKLLEVISDLQAQIDTDAIYDQMELDSALAEIKAKFEEEFINPTPITDAFIETVQQSEVVASPNLEGTQLSSEEPTPTTTTEAAVDSVVETIVDQMTE